MSDSSSNNRDIFESTRASRIYFLPNLMTAGNLFCGYFSVIKSIHAYHAQISIDPAIQAQASALYAHAVWFILAALLFDCLDGRLARIGGRESLFGKEFDSIADIISFGIAPALLVNFLIFAPLEEYNYPVLSGLGWFFSFIYLLCAGVRLARFNVITHPAVYSLSSKYETKDFIGLPTPAAAGLIASLVFFLNEYELRHWSLALPPLMLLTAWLMISSVRFSSFKELNWRTRIRPHHFILVFVGAVLIYQFRHVGFLVLFLGYIFYGLIRHLRVQNKRLEKVRQWRERRKKAANKSPNNGE
ncbi:MAG: phosphatidylcholine/phosphatidylserine synthase [Opitutales bacterium]|nr:phosphatidylcholine/phosphatidylserine synthase [Opitutales bacterium]MCH8540173.1 phosphatidylcholine/phosphatidylserine synthase [Opitutales bacterium]